MSTDTDFESVVFLLPCNGADASTSFTEVKGKTVTASGNAQISTAQSKWGGASAKFDGTGDFLSTPSNSDFDFGTGDWTIEGWSYRTAAGSGLDTIVSRWSNGYPFLIGYSGQTLQLYINGTLRISVASVSLNAWHHWAAVRSGTGIKFYVDGTASATVYNIGATALAASTSAVHIGTTAGDRDYFDGYLDDIRITKGVARYTSDFTPPEEAFPTSNALATSYGDMAVSLSAASFDSVGQNNVVLAAPAFSGEIVGQHFVDLTAPSVTFEASGQYSIAVTLPAAVFESGGQHSFEATLPSLTAQLVSPNNGGDVIVTLPTALVEIDDGLVEATSSLTLPKLSFLVLPDGAYHTSALTFPKLRAAASGSFANPVSATAAWTLPALTSVSVGGRSEAPLVLPKAAASIAGFAGVAAPVAITLPTIGLVASGTPAVLATLDGTLPRSTFDAAGAPGVISTLSLTLHRASFAASGHAGSAAVVDVSFPSFAGQITVLGTTVATVNTSLPRMFITALAERPFIHSATYVMNTQSSALSEYLNYGFNSFAEFNGMYLAAGTNGLVQIDTGVLDDAAEVAGRWKTGRLDFGSMQQKRAADLYGSVLTEGDVTMRVSVDKSEQYEYVFGPFSQDELVEARIQGGIAKGLRGRYWEFEFERAVPFVVEDFNVNVAETTRRV